jgi:predicted small metal-binding protein
MGNDCHFVAKGDSKTDALKKAAEHGMSVHKMKKSDMTFDLLHKALSVLKETD